MIIKCISPAFQLPLQGVITCIDHHSLLKALVASKKVVTGKARAYLQACQEEDRLYRWSHDRRRWAHPAWSPRCGSLGIHRWARQETGGHRVRLALVSQLVEACDRSGAGLSRPWQVIKELRGRDYQVVLVSSGP